MEPIRPDEDELRASRPERTKDTRVEKPKSKAKPASADRNGSGGGSRGLWLALLALAVAAGAGWWQQQQTLQTMQTQLEEADYWARQSKLALARFEGELSETGETLEEREQTLSQTLDSHAERLDTADSEIRKLWGIAYDRNRKRLDSNEEAIASLRKQLEPLSKTVPELKERLAGVVERAGANSGRLEDLAAASDRLSTSVTDAEEGLATLAKQVEDIDQSVERQLQRFGREQKLTLDGLDSRIGSLESKLADLPSGTRIESMQAELAELKQVVESIDSSRAQLTSRLVRLSEQVDAMRAGQ